MTKKAPKSANVSAAVSKRRAKHLANRDQVSFLEWCSHHRSLCFAVVAAIWVVALYWKAMSAPFVYDDLDQIVNNPSLRSWHATFVRFFLSPVSFTTSFLSGSGSTYRPLFWVTQKLDEQIWGIGSPGGFHFTNLLLHWANGFLLFQLLRRMNIPVLIGAATAIVWLGLPINTEAVTWVSSRAYLLSTFFILVGLLCADSYLKTRKHLFLASYFVLALAALLSHEQGVLLLPLTLILANVVNRREAALWMKLAGAVCIAYVVCIAVKHWVGAQSGKGAPALWSIGEVFWKYLLLMLAPVHMSIERSTSLPVNRFSIAAIVAWIAMLALLGAAFLFRKKFPVASAGVVCGWIMLLPYCGVVPIYQGMAERFLYLASIGFTLAIVSLAIVNRSLWNGITVWALLLWMIWGSWRLTARVLDWDDPVTLYRSSLEATPQSPSLFYNLGTSLRERSDFANALTAYQEAVHLKPDYQHAFASIGEVYARLGKPAEAIKPYTEALRLDPKDTGTMLNFAIALEQTDNNQLAEEQFKRAITLAPKDSAAYVGLGAFYVQENRDKEAILCFEKAIENKPDDPNPYFDLGVLFQKAGEDEMALKFYRKVLALKPNDPDTLLYMSKLKSQSLSN